ncbi:hypothetical protein [Paraburkholderia caribensis]|uniref:hypothetical protein n=1 Tax=Paraburkholderia caribensis TaxID=75105 RepID=UPI001CB0C886|nr:hypothetical protein [Paraburkholderia caribensis]CAG9262132.1 hypothetical protein PCAR4_560004 [Paraburkholderia caribensis]
MQAGSRRRESEILRFQRTLWLLRPSATIGWIIVDIFKGGPKVFKDRVLAGRVAGLAISVCIEIRDLHENFADRKCVQYEQAISAVINDVISVILVPLYDVHGDLHGLCDIERIEALQVKNPQHLVTGEASFVRPPGCKAMSKSLALRHSQVMWKIKRDLKRSLMTTGHASNDEEYRHYQSAVLLILASIYVNVLAPLGELYPDIVATQAQYMSISP